MTNLSSLGTLNNWWNLKDTVLKDSGSSSANNINAQFVHWRNRSRNLCNYERLMILPSANCESGMLFAIMDWILQQTNSVISSSVSNDVSVVIKFEWSHSQSCKISSRVKEHATSVSFVRKYIRASYYTSNRDSS